MPVSTTLIVVAVVVVAVVVSVAVPVSMAVIVSMAVALRRSLGATPFMAAPLISASVAVPVIVSRQVFGSPV
jgi:hypothetical protein